MNAFKLIAIAVILVFSQKAQAQIKVTKPAGLEQTVASRTAHRKNPNTRVKGYQILIHRCDDRNKAEQVKSKFNTEYTQLCEVIWDEPNFKVYVGSFTSKFECVKFLNEIKGKFQTAIIVSSMVPYTPID